MIEHCEEKGVSRIQHGSISDTRWKEIEERRLPVVIQGATDDWAAHNSWQLERLDSCYGDLLFEVKRGTGLERVQLREFLQKELTGRYVAPAKAAPYIFDRTFGDEPLKNALLRDYTVPTYLAGEQRDLFRLCHYHPERPSYRWFLVAPAGAGAPGHIDPCGTSAWNASIVGRKRWVLYPPDVAAQLPKTFLPQPALPWFLSTYPSVTQQFPEPIEIVQRPGELVFVPAGGTSF